MRSAAVMSSCRVHASDPLVTWNRPCATLQREPGEQLGEVGRVRGDAHLVGEHAVELAALVRAERPADEVGPPLAEHPRRADDRPRTRVRRELALAAELRAPVLREGRHRVPLVVRVGRSRRRRRSRWRCARRGRRRVRRRPRDGARRARWPRTRRSGSRSHWSTFVIAAAFTTASGPNVADHLLDLVAVGEVERSW